VYLGAKRRYINTLPFLSFQSHTPIASPSKCDFRTVLPQLTRSLLTPRVARSLCNSRPCHTPPPSGRSAVYEPGVVNDRQIALVAPPKRSTVVMFRYQNSRNFDTTSSRQRSNVMPSTHNIHILKVSKRMLHQPMHTV